MYKERESLGTKVQGHHLPEETTIQPTTCHHSTVCTSHSRLLSMSRASGDECNAPFIPLPVGPRCSHGEFGGDASPLPTIPTSPCRETSSRSVDPRTSGAVPRGRLPGSAVAAPVPRPLEVSSRCPSRCPSRQQAVGAAPSHWPWAVGLTHGGRGGARRRELRVPDLSERTGLLLRSKAPPPPLRE